MTAEGNPELSLLVDNPEITEVMSEDTGIVSSAREVVGRDWDRAVALRMTLHDAIVAGSHRTLCSLCSVPVYLVATPDKQRFFFKHRHEEGNCPARTRGSLSREQIDALRYHGQRESERHRRIKGWVEQSLRADPRFSSVVVEGTWKGKDASRRRPDVRAVYLGELQVAFEVQLSTTYISVMAERRHFYLSEGGLLCWVLPQFEEDVERMTALDAFVSNNHNVFVINEQSLAASLGTQALTLQIHWQEPYLHESQVLRRRQDRLLPFHELTIEQDKQRVYHYDWDGALSQVEQEREQAASAPVRNAFEAFWVSHDHLGPCEWQEPWLKLSAILRSKKFEVPHAPFADADFRDLVRACLSARLGRPVGWEHSNLLKVAHHIFEQRKLCLWAFVCALKAHDRGALFRSLDHNKKWVGKDGKVQRYRAAWKRGDVAFAPIRRWDALLAFLFPEVGQRFFEDPVTAA